MSFADLADYITSAKLIKRNLQIESREPLVALPDSTMAGFFTAVPDLVDLARHRGQHVCVLVFDARLECLGVHDNQDTVRMDPEQGLLTSSPQAAFGDRALPPRPEHRGFTRILVKRGVKFAILILHLA